MRIAAAALAVFAAVTGGLFGASPAHADDQAYIARANGLLWVHQSPQTTLANGYSLCRRMRDGDSPQQVVDQMSHVGWGMYMPWRELVDAAQQELCPDTL